MQQFWEWAASLWTRGKTDEARVQRLNMVLPRFRSVAEQRARTQATAEIVGMTKLGVAGSFAALVTLAGVAEWLSPGGREVLKEAGYCFAAAGVGALVAWLLSVVEPTFRARVARRIEAPDTGEPLTDEEDWRYSEALTERLWVAPHVFEQGAKWRLVSGLRTISLVASGTAFCIALVSAVGAIG